MKLSALKPRVHLYVCTNERRAGDPLGEGCGARGAATYAALKAAVARRGLVSSVWVARTGCLGICPKEGCTVGLSPGPRYVEEVGAHDADALLDAIAR